jgi:hypothetical protein
MKSTSTARVYVLSDHSIGEYQRRADGNESTCKIDQRCRKGQWYTYSGELITLIVVFDVDVQSKFGMGCDLLANAGDLGSQKGRHVTRSFRRPFFCFDIPRESGDFPFGRKELLPRPPLPVPSCNDLSMISLAV